MRTIICIVVLAVCASVFAFWLQVGLMNKLAPAAVVVSADEPHGTAARIFTTAEGCAGPALQPSSAQYDECERIANAELARQVQVAVEANVRDDPCPPAPQVPGRSEC